MINKRAIINVICSASQVDTNLSTRIESLNIFLSKEYLAKNVIETFLRKLSRTSLYFRQKRVHGPDKDCVPFSADDGAQTEGRHDDDVCRVEVRIQADALLRDAEPHAEMVVNVSGECCSEVLCQQQLQFVRPS